MDAFLKKISEIRSALKMELYNCALAVALTLPDICGKVEYPQECSSTKRYKDWFATFAEPLFTVPATKLPEERIVNVTWMTSEECWALRCAVLHAGNYDAERIKLADIRIHVNKRDGHNYKHMLRDAQYADWDGIILCENLCVAAEQYYHSIENSSRFEIDEVRIDN